MISVLFFGCKKDDDNLNTSNNSTNSAFDKPCNFLGMEYYNCTVTYTWDSGSGSTTNSDDCAYNTSSGGSSGDKTVQFRWSNIVLGFKFPVDSSTLSGLELNNSNQAFGRNFVINNVNDYDNYFYIEKIEDNMGVEWEMPYDTIISGTSYYHRFTSLDHQRDDNEIIWKIEGEFSTFVVNPNDNSQSRNVYGNYTIYQNTNRQ